MPTPMRRVPVLLAASLLASVSTAQLVSEVQTIPNPGPGFGLGSRALAADGDVFAARTTNPDTVHVFVRQANGVWTKVDQMDYPASPLAVVYALDVFGDTIVAGVPGPMGAVDVYRRVAGTDDWVLEDTLVADDGNPSEGFGFSTAIHGNTVVVGANLHNHGSGAEGAVYVYERMGVAPFDWVQTGEIHSPVPPGPFGSFFGSRVDLSQSFLLASSIPGVHVFDRTDDAWSFVNTLESSEERFGVSLALTDSVAIVGDPAAPSAGPFATEGAAYLYAPGALGLWQKELQVAPLILGIEFAKHVAASGDLVVATDEGSVKVSGQIQVHRRFSGGNWVRVAEKRDTFQPTSVAIAGSDFIVADSDPNTGASIVRVYRITDRPFLRRFSGPIQTR